MSAPPSPDMTHQPDDLSCHSRQTSQHSSAESTASIQSLHLASVPLSSFRPPASPASRSSSYASLQASPNSAATSYRVYRHDQNTAGFVDRGSALATGEVVGLMRTINLTSSPTTSIIPERDLEEGEIRDSPRASLNRPPRRHEQSFGGSLPSSPEVLPSASHPILAASSGVNSTNGLAALSTSSTLSSITSSPSFHTASSSSSIPTSISNSGSISDFSKSSQMAIASQGSDTEIMFTFQQQPNRGKVPETGTIDLEALDKDTTAMVPTLTHVPAHIPSSGGSEATSESFDSTEDQFKSPNVYINGLPPHFPEDQLFELTSPFGEIRSVRSFTRHVGEKESGYGFVLYETVEAAEKCIQSLRRFRNLHPTFSKQSHKIPGMPYTQSSESQSGWTHESDNGPSLAYGTGDRPMDGGASKNQNSEVSFKNKMERLQDPNSTNLYIEGLPLSIDEPSLSALVSPHRIKSSRFFQTRLSNPPRMIAFVRLETRQGAEEVVERLHGRMVRGWNDPGSRISVRFADTSEQRELRRSERSVREDDVTSPARLTIAQAALLNLRGRDQLRTQQETGVNIPLIGSSRLGLGSAPTANQIYSDFSSNAHGISSATAGGYRGSASDLTSAAQLLAGINGGPSRSANISPYHRTSPLSNVLGSSQDLTPAMAALLDSLRGSGSPWTGHDDRYVTSQRQMPFRNAHPILGDVDLNTAYLPQYQSSIGGGVAQTRSGYTPAEELILSAHAQRRKGGAYGDEHADFNVGVRGYRTQASTLNLPHSHQSYQTSSSNLPVVVESDADYEAEPHNQSTRYPRSQLNGRARAVAHARNSGLRERDDGQHQQQHQLNLNGLSHHNYNNLTGNNHNQQAHVRSTTLPPSSTPSTAAPRHYQHNSMSIPKSRNITNDIMRTTFSQTQPNANASHQTTHSKHRSTNSISSTITNDSNNHNNTHMYSDSSDIRISDGGPSYTDSTAANHTQHHYRHNYPSKTGDQELTLKKTNVNLNGGVYGVTHSFHRDPDMYDVPQTSPPLVSPALSYSSRGSGATLSPSTPYVGSFSASQEAGGDFQGRGIETEVADAR